MNALLAAALHYAEMGFRVLPVYAPLPDGGCACGRKDCSNPGKHPIFAAGLIEHGVLDATTDPEKIRAWWTRWPDANVAIATGNGLTVIDADPRNGGDDAELELRAEHGTFPDTPLSLTGGGGTHRLYHSSVPVKNGKLAPGVDVKGEGGYIVAPPSLHASGGCYQWEASSVLGEVPLAELPDWVSGLLGGKNGTANEKPAGKIPVGLRHSSLVTDAAKLRQAGLNFEEILASLTVLSRERHETPLPDDEIRAIADWVIKKDGTKTPTDDELADEWLERHPGTAYGLGDFRRYGEGIWPVVPKGRVEEEILAVLEEEKLAGIKPSAYRLRSVIELARIKATVPDDRWNADPDLLVLQNGTLQISTRTLRAHSQDDCITAALPYEYNPNASAEVLAYCLETTVPDAADFLQEFAGYSLTTATLYEVAVWLYGPAGSGKSTFIEGVRAMLGNRVGDLGLSEIERSRFALSDLPDKTLLVSAEQPAAFMERSYILNALISGETITVDRKYRDPLTLRPHAKILWAMNELPRVPEAWNGLFRRVKVIKFPPLMGQPDPQLKEAIKQEGPGILNWALDGLDRLIRRGGFDVPVCVQAATVEFQVTNDIPASFLQEQCIREPRAKTQSSKLYQTYRLWCLDNGHKAQSSTSISGDWERLGLMKAKEETGNYWYGARLK